MILYRPRFVVFAMVVFGLGAMALLTACTAEVAAELKTYPGVNAIRTKAGLPPLQPDRALIEAARERANDMAKTGHAAHDRIGGCPVEFTCVLDRRGTPYAYAGENIGWNNWPWAETADRAVTIWENSPLHLALIMNCHFTKFGTGVAQSPDGEVWYSMIFEGNATC